jgi:AcrR family transcriptional regulator
MRALTRAAGLSVSAANYHFGSKEELLRATLLRRLDPVNRRRLARLDALEAAPDAPKLEDLIECFLRAPLEQFDAMRRRGEGGFARHLLAWLYADRPERVADLKAELFGEVNARFVAALERALPGLRGARTALLLQLSIGTMVHVIGGQVDERLIEAIAAGAPAREDGAVGSDGVEPLLALLVTYVCAGLRASAPSTPDSAVAPTRESP